MLSSRTVLRPPLFHWSGGATGGVLGFACSTDLDQRLRSRGIDLLAIMGTTADCCVSATVREANDRGYDCLVLTDCVVDVSEARTASTLESFRINPLGATAKRSALLAALR